MALLYGAEHPYGRPPKGTIESVERLTRDAAAAACTPSDSRRAS